MTNRQKNAIGGAGFAVLILAGAAYGVWAWYPWNSDAAYQKKIMAVDVSKMDGPQMDAFVRSLQVNRLTTNQKVELWNRMLTHFWELPPEQMAALLKSAREEMEKNPNSPLSLNAQQLMQADGYRKAQLYVAAAAAEKQKMLDQEIAQQQTWANMQGMTRWGSNGLPSPERIDSFKSQIAFWIAQGLKTDDPTQRAAMTQYYTDMRQRRIDRGMPTMW